MIELTTERLPKTYGYSGIREITSNIQLLSPYREKTALSCKFLNEKIQKLLNCNRLEDKMRFKVGDKVIQNVNDYDNGIINGDIGWVKDIDTKEKIITVDFVYPDRTIELPLYDTNLDLAYCITTHKFQGSETKIVIIPIHSRLGPFITERNWLYTAISRAQSVCILVGQKGETPIIISRNKQNKRNTRLIDFLS